LEKLVPHVETEKNTPRLAPSQSRPKGMQPSLPNSEGNTKIGIQSKVVGEMFDMDKRVHKVRA
jgi:hypothetical protein